MGLTASASGADSMPCADSPIGHLHNRAPESGDTLRLSARAMACDFSIIMNGEEHQAIGAASSVLDRVGALDDQLSVYRQTSEVTRLNATASRQAVQVAPNLFQLLQLGIQIAEETGNAFDMTTAPLIALWRKCREQLRIPTDEEIARCLEVTGPQHVRLDETAHSVRFDRPEVSVNFGAFGKGHALDEMSKGLQQQGNEDYLLHGGRSSLLASGTHAGPTATGNPANAMGWPVGIGNPLLTNRRLGTILLNNQAMATSGSNIQHFRIGKNRYGHILDPRTGWPASGHLSVTVLAPNATMADALSTAFYVMETEEIREYCSRHERIGALLIPFPQRDRRVCPTVLGIDPDQLYWDAEQIKPPGETG